MERAQKPTWCDEDDSSQELGYCHKDKNIKAKVPQDWDWDFERK
jgi:hypothetical protein